MSAAEPRAPSGSSVWLEARAADRDPVAALVAAGLCTAAEVAPSETAGRSRPPPGERPRRQLKCHEGLAPEPSVLVEAELAARGSPSTALLPAPAIVAVPARRPRRRRRSGPARRAAG
jgi:hypothetical protein